MTFAVIFALISALAYGVSDFLGGTAATRLRVVPTTLFSYGAALAVLAVIVVVNGGVWSPEVWWWGSVAGLAAILGFVTFYAAMAVGPMSLVSPVIAVLGWAVPVAAAVVLGETLTLWAWVGVAMALASAVFLSSQPRTSRFTTRAVVLSIVSGVALGSSVVALDRAPVESESLAAFVEIGLGLVVLALIAALGRAIPPLGRWLAVLGGPDVVAGSRRRNVAAALAAGVLLAVANAALLAGLQSGSLAIVSVLVGLYPLATLLLARLVGGERITRLQLAGVALAIAASAVLGLALAG